MPKSVSISSAESFLENISSRLNKIDTNELSKPRVYNEYKRISILVEKAAKAFASSGRTEVSKKYWGIVANMHLKMLMESIGDKDKENLRLYELKLQASSAINASRNANDPRLIATVQEITKNMFRFYNLTLSSTEQELSLMLR